jgi:guanosine-3',5'-bis(diphosphate) 3'-pyrophosphohydrolase
VQTVQDLLDKTGTYLPESHAAFLRNAYDFAERAHDGQMRLSGEPYIQHPLNAALYLADMHLDKDTIAAALLHDVIEDCQIESQQLEDNFGKQVAILVNGVTKLSKVEYKLDLGVQTTSQWNPENKRQSESLRKMLVAMAEDVRVLMVKLADRLHNMATISSLPPDKRIVVANETMDIYAPLAGRLGMADMRWRLEDMALRELNPEQYRVIADLLTENRAFREGYIERVREVLSAALEKERLSFSIVGRAKHIYSIHQKRLKYETMGRSVDSVYDLYALRVFVDSISDCYAVLGAVHQLWRPIPGEFDDYIANPKANLYQSLHTTVSCLDNNPLEIQVRTYEMDAIAEHGVAAHWYYKNGKASGSSTEDMAWLKQVLHWDYESSGPEEFVETVRMDLFKDEVFIYTPKGEVKELPIGATPLDFAYRIHTDLGHRCIGAKVNGRLVSLNTQLATGDTVEIITSKAERGPSLDWLNQELGFVQTAGARQSIRAWFRRQEREINVERGKSLLAKELRRLNISLTGPEVIHLLGLESDDDLYLKLGNGSLTLSQLDARLTSRNDTLPAVKYSGEIAARPAPVEVLGVGDLLTRMAPCCMPVPGDTIIGFVTRSRGVTIHRNNCLNILNEDEPERIIPVNWGTETDLAPVRIRIEAWDRIGLLRDVTTLLSGEKVNIASVATTLLPDEMCVVSLTIYTPSLQQLTKLLLKLESIKGTVNVGRMAGLE